MSSPNYSIPSSGWTITGQVEGVQVSTAGRVVNGTTVYFVTGNGDAGSVFVEAAKYNAETVTALVGARAMQLDAIANLSMPKS
jgi:folate-dependent phosphoribosylglycinamide formyltransferase PurN